jgi:acetyl esterase/lipase
LLKSRSSLARVAPVVACAMTFLAGCSGAGTRLIDALTPTSGYVATTDVAYGDGPRRKLDVYVPATLAAGAKAPVVVFFYGGSWENGKRRWYRYVGDALADNGVIVLIPDYRKFPDVRFPAFMHDAANAVAWARDHAAEFGGDSKRLFVMGHSAGGQIAALLAADKHYLQAVGMRPRDLAGMIGLAGAYAFLPFVDDEAEIFGDDAKGRYDSQPINFVDGDEPPMLLLQGTDDDEVPPNNAEVMDERAQAMDGTARLKLYPGVSHSAIILALAREHTSQLSVLADTLAFIAAPGLAN